MVKKIKELAFLNVYKERPIIFRRFFGDMSFYSVARTTEQRLNNGEYDKIIRKIRQLSPLVPSGMILDAVDHYVQGDWEGFCKYSDSLKEYYKNENLKAYRWKTLSTIYTTLGLFGLGYLCREKCKEAVKNSPPHYNLHDRFVIAMEEKKYDLAKEVLDEIGSLGFVDQTEIRKMHDFYGMMSSDPLRSGHHNKIFVLGPLVSVDQNKDMDGDIVLMNYVGNKIQKNNGAVLSFYNREALGIITNKGLSINTDGIFVYSDLDLRMYKLPDDHRVFFYDGIDELLLWGHANMLPIVLYHYCSKQEDDVFAKGFSMYIGKLYSDAYYFKKKDRRNAAFAIHELIANFVFVKNLFDEKKISVDEEFEKILKMSESDYVSLLEREQFGACPNENM